MFEKAQTIAERYKELNQLLASPEVAQDADRIRIYAQERSKIEETAQIYRRWQKLTTELQDTRMMLDEEDADMRNLIADEIARLESALEKTEAKLKELLISKDPRDERNVIVEIRAGTGGEEAALFAADLFRMYSMYADAQGWNIQMLSSNETGIGGFKEVIFEIKGKGAFSRLKYESGVHRVQRVPETETSGRIHTSTATVAVLPEAEEVEVEIKDEDLRIDVFRAGGHGGQSVNTADSAVRITHLPTGIVAQCQNERSQLQNRQRAMEVLRARIYAKEYRSQLEERDEARRQQVGSGERSEKIRTYNFPQNRVTDHRTNMSVYQLEGVLEGNLDPFIEELASQERLEQLAVKTG